MRADVVDFQIPEAEMCVRPFGLRMFSNPWWTSWHDERVHDIFSRGGTVVDIGGGLRIDGKRGNRENPVEVAKFKHWLSDPRVRFVVTDYTDTYHPDRVEDIHHLSLEDESVDGLFCMAVLEHVYDPKRAAEEIVRVLKKDGRALLYVPWIYRYHAATTQDYRDYFRYSKDGIAYLFRGCSQVALCPVRGLFETLLRFTPLHRVWGLPAMLRLLDWSSERMRTVSLRQASGYFISIVK